MVSVLFVFLRLKVWVCLCTLFFGGCSHSMELWLITSVWPASCSALCANTHACWKGSYSFVLVQQKAITIHMREYASAAEKANTMLPCALFALLILRYFIIWEVFRGIVSALLQSMGRACDPVPAVSRCHLTTSVSVVRSLDWNATLSCFIYLNVLGFNLWTVWTLTGQFYGKDGWELKVMVRKNMRHFVRGILFYIVLVNGCKTRILCLLF